MNKNITLKKLSRNPSCIDDYDPNAMDFEKANQFLEQFLSPTKISEKISIKDSLGRVIAKDIKSLIDVPNYDNSAMDGYAIKFNKKTLIFKIMITKEKWKHCIKEALFYISSKKEQKESWLGHNQNKISSPEEDICTLLDDFSFEKFLNSKFKVAS